MTAWQRRCHPKKLSRIQANFRQHTACKQAVTARGKYFRLPLIRARIQGIEYVFRLPQTIKAA